MSEVVSTTLPVSIRTDLSGTIVGSGELFGEGAFVASALATLGGSFISFRMLSTPVFAAEELAESSERLPDATGGRALLRRAVMLTAATAISSRMEEALTLMLACAFPDCLTRSTDDFERGRSATSVFSAGPGAGELLGTGVGDESAIVDEAVLDCVAGVGEGINVSSV